MGVEILAKELLGLPGIDGITFSGGEPTSQAAALCRLIDLILSCRDLSMMAYTGFTLDYLRAHGSPSQQALLDRLDILIDGPFVAARHTDLRWRGSDNQSVHFLTSRHEDLRHLALDRGRWLELTMDQDGSLGWMGVPPPGFREAFEQSLARQGILVNGGLEYEQFPEV
jgi:anaerobic ribonucleoside-triphosphate reductase activating protein